MDKKTLQRYIRPEMEVIEFTEKDGVMQNIVDASTSEDLSRTTNHYDDNDADLSRHQHTVWDVSDVCNEED